MALVESLTSCPGYITRSSSAAKADANKEEAKEQADARRHRVAVVETGSAVAVRWRKSHAPARDIVSTCCGGDGAEMGAFIALFFLAAVLS